MRQELVNHFTWITNQFANLNTYNWSAKFKEQEVKSYFETFYNSIKKYLNLEELTVQEAKELRFQKWDDKSDLWLFPLWVLPLIPEGMEVVTISGETIKFNRKEVDDDIRFGCLAFGVVLKE